MWILVAVLILLTGVVFIVQPLLAGARDGAAEPGGNLDTRAALVSEKEALYAALKDLDFEYRTGKLSDKDYQELRESYRARALSILSAADGSASPAPTGDPEGLVQCRRCAHANPPGSKFCESCGARLTGQLACRACGAAVAPDDRFCWTCGTAVREPVAVPAGVVSALQGDESHDS